MGQVDGPRDDGHRALVKKSSVALRTARTAAQR
jgi:hypothetical protein